MNETYYITFSVCMAEIISSGVAGKLILGVYIQKT
jgi:hypothetical protein